MNVLINSNLDVRIIMEEMNKYSELAGLGVRLLNHT